MRYIREVAVPETTVLTFAKGKRSAAKEKILPGYILVQVEKEVIEDEAGDTVKVFPPFTQKTIRDTFNVIGFAGADKNKPRQMRPSEVKNVFERADRTFDEEPKPEPKMDYNIGDVLEVVSGPFGGQDLTVTGIQGTKLLGQVSMFGRVIPAEFTADQVKTKETN